MILDVSGQNPVRNGFRESLGTVLEFSWRPISGLLDQRLSELRLRGGASRTYRSTIADLDLNFLSQASKIF